MVTRTALKESIVATYNRFNEYRNSRNNPNNLNAEQLGGMFTQDIYDLANQKYPIGSIPIDRIGNLSYLPLGIEGDFGGMIRVVGVRNFSGAFEDDGSFTFLTIDTDGFQSNAFYNSIAFSDSGSMEKYSPRGKVYRNKFMIERGLSCYTMVNTDGNDILILGTTGMTPSGNVNRWMIVKTNNTLDDTKHEASFLEFPGLNTQWGITLKGNRVWFIVLTSVTNSGFCIYYADISKIGIEETIPIIEMDPNNFSTKGFPRNDIVSNRRVVFDSMITKLSDTSKSSIMKFDDSTIRSNYTNSISSFGTRSFSHPSENKIRSIFSCTRYFSQDGKGIYKPCTFIFDFDIDKMEITPTGKSLTNQTTVWKHGNNQFTSTGIGSRDEGIAGHFWIQDHGSFTYAVSPNGVLFRSYADSEADFTNTRWKINNWNGSLWNFLELVSNKAYSLGPGYSNGLPRYSASLITKIVNGLYRFSNNVVATYSQASLNTLNSVSRYVLTRLENEPNYEYAENVKGYKPSTFRIILNENVAAISNTNYWDSKDNLTVFNRNFYYWWDSANRVYGKINAYDDITINSNGEVVLGKETKCSLIVEDIFYNFMKNSGYGIFPRESTILNVYIGDFSPVGLPAFIQFGQYSKDGAKVRFFLLTGKVTYTGNVITGLTLEKVIFPATPTSEIWGISGLQGDQWTVFNRHSLVSNTIQTKDNNLFYIYFNSPQSSTQPGGSNHHAFKMIWNKGENKLQNAKLFRPATWSQGASQAFYDPKLGGWVEKDLPYVTTTSNSAYPVRRLNMSTESRWLNGNIANLSERFIMFGAKVAQGFVLYINDIIDTLFSGDYTALSTGTYPLTDITPSPGNKTFHIHVIYRGSKDVILDISLTKKVETKNIIYLGTMKTNADRITSIEVEKVTRIDGKRLSVRRQPYSIPLTYGVQINSGNIDGWLLKKDPAIGSLYHGGYYLGVYKEDGKSFRLIMASIQLNVEIGVAVNTRIYSEVADSNLRGNTKKNGLMNTFCLAYEVGNPVNTARKVFDFLYKGYNDWYIPSAEELKLIGTNRFKGMFNNSPLGDVSKEDYISPGTYFSSNTPDPKYIDNLRVIGYRLTDAEPVEVLVNLTDTYKLRFIRREIIS